MISRTPSDARGSSAARATRRRRRFPPAASCPARACGRSCALRVGAQEFERLRQSRTPRRSNRAATVSPRSTRLLRDKDGGRRAFRRDELGQGDDLPDGGQLPLADRSAGATPKAVTTPKRGQAEEQHAEGHLPDRAGGGRSAALECRLFPRARIRLRVGARQDTRKGPPERQKMESNQ